jgi:hypothetical protein
MIPRRLSVPDPASMRGLATWYQSKRIAHLKPVRGPIGGISGPQTRGTGASATFSEDISERHGHLAVLSSVLNS